jgi:hypothetical protein
MAKARRTFSRRVLKRPQLQERTYFYFPRMF